MQSGNGLSICERLFHVVVQFLLWLLACWTITYHVIFIARWPSLWQIPMSCSVLLVCLCCWLPQWIKYLKPVSKPRCDWSAIFPLIILSLLVSMLSTVANRPDADDIGYFHRALVQLGVLDGPFLVQDTTHYGHGIPGMPSTHLLTSYEMLFSLVGGSLGLDPLSGYQNVGGAVFSGLLPIVYFLMGRELGLTPRRSFTLAAGCVLFLVFDGNIHRSYGNFGFVRMWQGKSVLMTVVVPLIWLYCRMFWNGRSLSIWVILVLIGIVGTGLSAIGFFFVPLTVFVCSTGLAVTSIWHDRQASVASITTYGALLFSSFYCVVLTAMILDNLVPTTCPLSASHAMAANYGDPSWFEAISSVVGGSIRLLGIAIAVFVFPWFVLDKRTAASVVLPVAVLVAVCINPVLGPLWHEALSVVYWRVAYAIPVPLYAGMFLVLMYEIVAGHRPQMERLIRIGVVTLALLLAFLQFDKTTVSERNHVTLKSPGAYRFEPAILECCKTFVPFLDHANVLVPEELVVCLGLLNDTVRFEAQRNTATEFFFALAGRSEEGLQRIRSQQVVGCLEEIGGKARVLNASLARNVSAIIVANGCLKEVLGLLPRNWCVARTCRSYTLILKKTPGGSTRSHADRTNRICR
jgi:hypothetical protein